MRNYVKEIEFIESRKISFENLFLPGLTGVFFLGYSALIFIHNQEYYKIFSAFCPLALTFPCYTFLNLFLSDDEQALKDEIGEARKFLEKSSGKADNEGINALVDLYRSRKGENKWNSIDDMLLEAFPDKGELRKTISGIIEN